MKKKLETKTCPTCGLEFPVTPPPPEAGNDPYAAVRDFDSLIALKIVEKVLENYLNPVPSRATMIKMITAGTFEGLQFGGCKAWYIRHSSLDAFLAARQQKLAA